MSTAKIIFKKVFWCFHNFNSRNCIYKFVSLLGVIFRVIFLPMIFPDIFSSVADFFIHKLSFPPLLYEILLRIVLFVIDSCSLLEIFYLVSFATVGVSYSRGSAPVWGSICYSFYYTAYWIIPVILFLYFKWWVILLAFIGYIALSAIINVASYFLGTLPNYWILCLCIQGFIAVIIFVGLLLFCLL